MAKLNEIVVKVEPNQWYCHPEYPLFMLFMGRYKTYGFDGNGEWVVMKYPHSWVKHGVKDGGYYTPDIDTINSRLKEEAIRRGLLMEGEYIQYLNGTVHSPKDKIKSLSWWSDIMAYTTDRGAHIMEGGNWACRMASTFSKPAPMGMEWNVADYKQTLKDFEKQSQQAMAISIKSRRPKLEYKQVQGQPLNVIKRKLTIGGDTTCNFVVDFIIKDLGFEDKQEDRDYIQGLIDQYKDLHNAFLEVDNGMYYIVEQSKSREVLINYLKCQDSYYVGGYNKEILSQVFTSDYDKKMYDRLREEEKLETLGDAIKSHEGKLEKLTDVLLATGQDTFMGECFGYYDYKAHKFEHKGIQYYLFNQS